MEVEDPICMDHGGPYLTKLSHSDLRALEMLAFHNPYRDAGSKFPALLGDCASRELHRRYLIKTNQGFPGPEPIRFPADLWTDPLDWALALDSALTVTRIDLSPKGAEFAKDIVDLLWVWVDAWMRDAYSRDEGPA